MSVNIGIAQNAISKTPQAPQVPTESVPIPVVPQMVLSQPQLQEISRLLVQLEDESRELHAEFHEHLLGVYHGEKLEMDAEEIEKTAATLKQFVATSNGDAESVSRIRSATNYFMQNAFEISRTIDLAEPWTRNNHQRGGIHHMRDAAQIVTRIALQIEAYLPPNAFEVDGQIEQLEEAIKELHAEFHEHLQGYQVSRHLEQDLHELEEAIEHMHELCHEKTWQQIDMNHLRTEIQALRQLTGHVEEQFVRQSRIGVRTSDWVGIEHSKDAITDVLSGAYLLEFMINKTSRPPSRNSTGRPGQSGPGQPGPGQPGNFTPRRRPKRDR